MALVCGTRNWVNSSGISGNKEGNQQKEQVWGRRGVWIRGSEGQVSRVGTNQVFEP